MISGKSSLRRAQILYCTWRAFHKYLGDPGVICINHKPTPTAVGTKGEGGVALSTDVFILSLPLCLFSLPLRRHRHMCRLPACLHWLVTGMGMLARLSRNVRRISHGLGRVAIAININGIDGLIKMPASFRLHSLHTYPPPTSA